MLNWREREKIKAEEELRGSLRDGSKRETITAWATAMAAVAAIASAVTSIQLAFVTKDAAVRQEQATYRSNMLPKQIETLMLIESMLDRISLKLYILLFDLSLNRTLDSIGDTVKMRVIDIDKDINVTRNAVSGSDVVFGGDIRDAFHLIRMSYASAIGMIKLINDPNSEYYVANDAGNKHVIVYTDALLNRLRSLLDDGDTRKGRVLGCMRRALSSGLPISAEEGRKCAS